MRARRAPHGRALAAAGLVVAVCLVPASSVQAEVGFSAVAGADGLRVTYSIPNYLIVSTLVDGGAPTAQSVLTSAGKSQSFAALPYPGDTVLAVPGLIAGVGGPELPVQEPLYVSADSTGPDQSSLHPAGDTAALDASAQNDPPSATARVGPAAATTGQLRAGTTVSRAANGTVTAVAESVALGVSTSDGLLKIASVDSTVKTVLASGRQPVTTRHLAVSGASVAGVSVGIGPDGIVGAGPSGVDTTGLLGPSRKALESAGVSVRLVPGQDLPSGGTADAIEITSTQALPVPGNPVGTMKQVVGSARTSVLSGVESDGPLATPAVTPPPDAQTAVSTPFPPTQIGAPASAIDNVQVSPRAARISGAGVAARRVASSTLGRDLRKSMRFLYGALFLGLIAVVASGAIWRHKGVRATWRS
jgi:hypothetical protein